MIAFDPDLVLVSARLDAYIGDSHIDYMTLEKQDFATHDTRLASEAPGTTAAILESGHPAKSPIRVHAFLTARDGNLPSA